MATLRADVADWIRTLRTRLSLTQGELAERLGVTFVTVSRWENGQARPNRLAMKVLATLSENVPEALSSDAGASSIHEPQTDYAPALPTQALDFRAESETVRLFVEGERLRYGHLFSPTFGVEIALIDPFVKLLVRAKGGVVVDERSIFRSRRTKDKGGHTMALTQLKADEIVDRAVSHRWGIPEFQRGFVWTPQKVRDLAESLWAEYPIGTFLLWKSGTSAQARVAHDAQLVEAWVVDGQQRTTALCLLFGRKPYWWPDADEWNQALDRFDVRFSPMQESEPFFVLP